MVLAFATVTVFNTKLTLFSSHSWISLFHDLQVQQMKKLFYINNVREGTGQGRSIKFIPDLSMLSKKVTDAEILWGLICVNSHFSGNSNAGVNDLFKIMFSYTAISANYSMSESKFRHITTFRLGPHFARKLLYHVKRCPAQALLFRES